MKKLLYALLIAAAATEGIAADTTGTRITGRLYMDMAVLENRVVVDRREVSPPLSSRVDVGYWDNKRLQMIVTAQKNDRGDLTVVSALGSAPIAPDGTFDITVNEQLLPTKAKTLGLLYRGADGGEGTLLMNARDPVKIDLSEGRTQFDVGKIRLGEPGTMARETRSSPRETRRPFQAGPDSKSPKEVARLLAEQGKIVKLTSPGGNAKREIEEDEKDEPRFKLPYGDSPAVLFELPHSSSAYALKIVSRCNCMGFRKSLFVPSAVFFDADFNPTHGLDENALTTTMPGFSSGLSVSAAVVMDDDWKDDRYLLVYTMGPGAGVPAGQAKSDDGYFIGSGISLTRASYGTLVLEAGPATGAAPSDRRQSPENARRAQADRGARATKESVASAGREERENPGQVDVSIKDAGWKQLPMIDQGRAGGHGSMQAGGNSWDRVTEKRWCITVGLQNSGATPGRIVVPMSRLLVVDTAKWNAPVVESDTVRALRGAVLETAKWVSSRWDSSAPAIVEDWLDENRRRLLSQSLAPRYTRFEFYGGDGVQPYAAIKVVSGGDWEVSLSARSSLLLNVVFRVEGESRPNYLRWPERESFALFKE